MKQCLDDADVQLLILRAEILQLQLYLQVPESA